MPTVTSRFVTANRLEFLAFIFRSLLFRALYYHHHYYYYYKFFQKRLKVVELAQTVRQRWPKYLYIIRLIAMNH